MTDEFLQLRIVRISPETKSPGQSAVKSYFLEPINGQPVSYQAGQFLTLILRHNGHEVRRSYSLSSAPGEPLRLTIKRVQNGEISRFLVDTLQVGDVLTTLHPAGRFTLDDKQSGNIILLGAGSGITPLFSLLKQILWTNTNQHVTLLYSNSTQESIIFQSELDDLQRQFSNRFKLLYLLSNPPDYWTGLRGRLNNVLLEQLLPELVGASTPETLRFYICGPSDYMRMVQFSLVFSGFRREQIRQENFVINPVTATPPPILAQDRTVLIHFRGQEVEIQVPAYKSILQAALDEGIHLPYSCRGGRCSTCIARCLSGSVYMTINDVLTEHDLADGWVLTCTGYPESHDVVIEL
ncbi:ferredoxin--NADP reductase [Spirosoma spitsbergense]|uniref:ferredoxin--NADP reductase n=1 Tax=Spirosoma spitsbergense TaxID=431554 RepID=UPI000382DDEC|nr:ferredoxin--NADP reductase [Spirosoma spitsbergense]